MSSEQPAPHSPYFLDWAWQNKVLMIPIVLALMFSICGGCFGLAYINSIQAMRKHSMHRQAVEAARENPAVVEELGSPMEGGFITEGTIEVDDLNQEGYADCTIPISGPKGTAKLFVKAKLTKGEWIVEELQVSLTKASQIITLIPDENADEPKPDQPAEVSTSSTEPTPSSEPVR